MSSEPQEGSVREQLSAAEGTSVQNEEELCRQRRLLDNDMSWNPQIQLHHIVLPQYWMTEEEDLCNQQRTFRVEEDEPVPPQIKEEPGELSISQDEDQLDLKQETDTLMEIPTYEENENSEADLNNQQSFDVTKSQDEEGNQHEESTSTTDEETDPLNRNQRKRRDRRHVQSVESSHMSEDDVVLLASSSQDLQRALGRFAAECEAAGMKVCRFSTRVTRVYIHLEQKMKSSTLLKTSSHATVKNSSHATAKNSSHATVKNSCFASEKRTCSPRAEDSSSSSTPHPPPGSAGLFKIKADYLPFTRLFLPGCSIWVYLVRIMTKVPFLKIQDSSLFTTSKCKETPEVIVNLC
ncbi:uncharacterized protein LOC144987864 isoform X1 [Oryzias latipes]